MRTDRLQKQLPIDAVEKAFDVDVEHKVIPPAALARRAHGIDSRFAGPVAVGIGVEHRLQDWLQITPGDLLSNAIGHCWNAQWPRPAIRLWNFDPPHRRRKIAPRRQPVPEPVEVARKVGLELQNRLPVHSSRSLVRLHTFEGFPDLPLGDRKRLCLIHGLLLLPVGPRPRLNNAAPSLQPHYRAFAATTGCSVPQAPHRYFRPCGFSRLCLFPWHRSRGSHVPLSFAPPTCRMPFGQYQGIPRTDPRGRVSPRF